MKKYCPDLKRSRPIGFRKIWEKIARRPENIFRNIFCFEISFNNLFHHGFKDRIRFPFSISILTTKLKINSLPRVFDFVFKIFVFCSKTQFCTNYCIILTIYMNIFTIFWNITIHKIFCWCLVHKQYCLTGLKLCLWNGTPSSSDSEEVTGIMSSSSSASPRASMAP